MGSGEQEVFGPSADICDPLASFSCLVFSGRQYKNFTYLADIPPDAARCDYDIKLWQWNDSILSQYWSPEDGIASSVSEDRNINRRDSDTQPHYLTYGEVTRLGVRQLAYGMGIANCDAGADRRRLVSYNQDNNENEIIFYDLGSGVGRLVTQIYMDQPDRIAKAVGIELAEDRHVVGVKALEGIMEEQYAKENFCTPYNYEIESERTSDATTIDPFPIQLIHGDATEVDFDPATTHVFISSLCFPEEVLVELQKKLLRLSNIRVIAALNHLNLVNEFSGRQWEEQNVHIQMSWGDSVARIYRRGEF